MKESVTTTAAPASETRSADPSVEQPDAAHPVEDSPGHEDRVVKGGMVVTAMVDLMVVGSSNPLSASPRGSFGAHR